MYLLKGILDFLTILFRRPKFLFMIATLVLTVVTVMTVYGVGVVSDVPVYVVDHDNSTVSRSLRLFLDAGPDLKVLGTLDTLEEAEDVLRNGEAAAVVYIPNGVSQAVKTQSGGRVFAYLDGSNMLLARNADKAIQTVVKTASVGVSMIAVNKKGMPKHELMGALQPIRLDVDRPFNTLTLYSEYLVPVLIFFCLNIFICLMTCACYQEPLPEAVRQHSIRKRFFYFGRLLVVFVLSLLGGLWMYQYGLPRVDIVLQSMPIMALSALLVYVALTQALFASINLLTPKPIAMSLSYLTCMLSVMFSGLTWPLEMMPWYIREFATWIPLTPFLQSVQVFLYHDANWGDLADFYQMFLKQLVLYAILIFAAMRMRDIKLFTKWVWRKLRGNSVEDAPSGNGDAVAVGVTSQTSVTDGVAHGVTSQTSVTDEVAHGVTSQTLVTDGVAHGVTSQTLVTDEVTHGVTSQTSVTDEVAHGVTSQTSVTDEVAQTVNDTNSAAGLEVKGRSRRKKRAKSAREDQP
ncbi:MAG: ABC transporter permease [Proteobacteria bacterium]|nr:ABC transporter permease [Pseudomonadota bacterium]